MSIQVSVIIPTYRRPIFLRTALESVLAQTFPDFEVMVVDDASQDNTLDVVKEFDDNRIQYIAHEFNKGGSAARNTGIRHARGEYIAFLDDDDEWLPEKLELQVEVLNQSRQEVGGVYTGCTKIERESGMIVCCKTPTQRGNLFQKLLRKNCITSTSSILLRKECFERVGLFDERLPSSQDYDLWLRISKVFKFESISKSLFIYHIHEKKIGTNLEALSEGLCLMLQKYETNLSIFKKNFGYYGCLELGAFYCLHGNVKKGQESYLKAIVLFPFGLKAYCMVGLCFLGERVVKKAFDLKRGFPLVA
ncbi:glycosyltransferase family 2 protein [Candidatus Nitrospira salsa]